MSEHIEQVRFVNWLTVNGIKHTSIPSGFHSRDKNYAEIQKLKAEGWHKGFPDLCLIVPHRGSHAICFIEMKSSTKRPKRNGTGGVSDSQRGWIDAINECENVGAFVCYGDEEAKALVRDLMKQ